MTISRRTVLAGLAATAAVPILAGPVRAQNAPSLAAPGVAAPAVRERTVAFLAALAPEKAARARFALDSDTWRNWNYMGNTLVKPGVRFEEMDAAEQGAGVDLLTAMLSPEGYAKADRVRVLQDVLAAQRIGPRDRNSGRFSLAVFDEPGPGVWGLRFEGHHLELNLTLRGDEIVSTTPTSFSCNPNEVSIGPTAGTTAIVVEEQAARRLFADLAPARQAEALIRDRPLNNIVATAGREDFFRNRQGLPAAGMSDGQRDLLWQVIDAYAADHWPGPLANAQRARVREGDQAAIHFAWAGPNVAHEPLYYRLHGDTFLIELAAVDSAAQHLHTIYHDSERTLGRHVAG